MLYTKVYIIKKKGVIYMTTISLSNSLYAGNDIPEVVRLYQKELRNGNIPINASHADVLENYLDHYTDTSELNLICKLIDSFLQKRPNLYYDLSSRIKAFISTEVKIRKKKDSKKALDVEDFSGIRIVDLKKNTTIEDIYRCFHLVEDLINFLSLNGFRLTSSSNNKNRTSAFDRKKYPQILVPEENDEVISAFDFLESIDNYITYPNKDGYQSLHFTIRSASTLRCYEIQVRLWGMNMWAEYGPASHNKYKQEVYAKHGVKFDRTRMVNLMGYEYFPAHDNEPEKFIDKVGLEQSLSVFSSINSYKK